ncbi:MAG TPA: hypothetical protein PKW79_07335, partial [Rhabdochlamydiaceae bacterium]|nr:hypothetical protein [Rhabdochlamydiaceae bacterium]
YTGFPWLAAALAKDKYLPRQMAGLGDRLVYSNSILGLSLAAIVLLVLFSGNTHSLIPLYIFGVFLGFTLSQIGMLKFHLKEKKPGWQKRFIANLVGGVTTLAVTVIVAVTRFVEGAWIVVFIIPVVVIVLLRINRHYFKVEKELSLAGLRPPDHLIPNQHTVIVPISSVHRGVIDALKYAISISKDVRAVYVEITPEQTAKMQAQWEDWGHEIPFVVLKSPYRSIIRPLLEYLDDLEQTTHGDVVTVVLPEFVTAKWWHQFLHNQTALMIRTALLFKKGKVVTSVRYHLKST